MMPNSAPYTAYRFGGLTLDLGRGALLTTDRRELPLRPKSFALLRLLVENAGRLLSRDAIMEAIWPDVFVSDDNITQCIRDIRSALGADAQQMLRTLPRRGYVFTSDVIAIPAAPHRSGADASGSYGSQPSASTTLPERNESISVLSDISLTTGAETENRAAAPRLSIVVLPFENLSGDASDDYLADGVTDDLTTDLSRLPGMFVIARTSAYSYKSKPVDTRKIGDELGVRYLLQGSVRKLGATVRVNAQLIAAETGSHLWADRFDQQLSDLSAGQEQIVQRIGLTLNVALTDIESARSKRERPTEPDAFDLILRARSIGMHPMGPRENAARLALYEQALRLDPTAVLAMMGIATVLIETGRKGDELDRVAKLLAEARAIDPSHQLVLSNTGYLLAAQHCFAEAIPAYQLMLDYYPNFTAAYANIGRYLMFAGRSDEAIQMIEMSIRRDPRTAYLSHRASDIGFALLALERYEEAIVWMQRAVAAGPLPAGRFAQNYLRIAAAQARLGHLDAAHRALAEANRIWPYDTVRSHAPEDLSSPVYVAQVGRFQVALRLAGHRDHADEDADFGVVSDDRLHQDDYYLAGNTPTTAPGAQTICTAELSRFLAERKPIVIDSLEYFWGRSIPGAVGLMFVGWGSSVADAIQDRLRRKMQELTRGDRNKAIVAVGWNCERFDGRNLALRLVALGYTQVYWYRGGREAWEVNGLPENELAATPW
jgi:adenylate cyclase